MVFPALSPYPVENFCKFFKHFLKITGITENGDSMVIWQMEKNLTLNIFSDYFHFACKKILNYSLL